MKRLIFSLLFLLLVGLSASAQQGSHPRLAGEPDRKELLQMIDSCIKAENQIQMQGTKKPKKDFSPIFWFGMGLITSQLIVIVRNVALLEGDE